MSKGDREEERRKRKQRVRNVKKANATDANAGLSQRADRDDHGRWLKGVSAPGLRNPAKRCTARRTDGKPCGQAAIPGGVVCRFHGGSAPQTIAAARRRLIELLPEAVKQHALIIEKQDTSDADRLRAIAALYNRVGLSENVKIDVTGDETNRYAALLARLAGLTPNEQGDEDARRAALGLENVIDAEVVEDEG